MTGIGKGVMVFVEVTVAAGNIKVIAGNGIRVVVGVCDAVAEGVKVCEGVPWVSVGPGVPVRAVGVTVAA